MRRAVRGRRQQHGAGARVRWSAAATAGLLVALAGCTSGGGTALPRPASSACARDDGVLRIVTGSDLSGSGIRSKLIDAWAADHRNLKVEVVELPDDADGQRSQLVAALQAGNKDCYDIVNLDVTWTAEFAAQGLIDPLPDSLRGLLDGGHFWSAARGSVHYKGKDWAVPWNTDVGLLYYRADLLGDHPSFKTWHDLTQAVGSFDRTRDKRLRAGLLTQLAPYEGLTVNASEAVWREGGDIAEGDGDDVAVTVEGITSLAGSVRQEEKDTDTLPVIGRTSLTLDETGTVEHFLAGEALTMRNWPFAAARLAEAETKGGRDTGAKGPRPVYAVTRLPRPDDDPGGSAAALGGQNLAMVRDSPNAGAAAELIEHLAGAGAQRCLRDGGFVPALRSGGEGRCDAEKLVSGDPPASARPPKLLGDSYRTALDESLKGARTRPVTPYYAAVTRDIQEWVYGRLTDAAPMSVPDFRDRLRKALSGR
ncbi:extracellular solute-binding protein [Streptomyces tsukubensis]|uniref:ABC transporter substrate-binding protein n=1 Tax=Streptomyces tsukubensis TaxID=83656 RepID=A0A1V4AAK7_9ACTN|nr:extracellular solute-binding protein [Streptomyces tsukubensis]OON80822.1 hypothetical protein B1H18_10525 [Streptomyces tsukubensis]QFR93538.1 extracellular solute-binding protein [Streptomyces tsukubensis]